METYEVYALNIQPTQLKQVLSTDRHTTEGIEEERSYFKGWLKEQYNNGFKYSDQCAAWEAYKIYIDFSYFDEEDGITVSWEDEIWEAYMNKVFVNPRNYSETAGQQ